MLIVTDTTTPLYLARLGKLALLQELYQTVVLPSKVWWELVEKKPDADQVAALRAATWLQVDSSADGSPLFVELQENLDDGEAAAIALAVHLRADLVFIDERIGRREAETRGLEVQGLIGTLIKARKAGLLPALRPTFDALQTAGFHAAPALYRRALIVVGEDPG